MDAKNFEMFTVLVEIVLSMTTVQRHEELLENGLLSKFSEALGRALFVSHQWCSMYHPDPTGVQFRTLQEVLKRLMSGTSQVMQPISEEAGVGRMKLPQPRDFTSHALYIWYDYFSIPQGKDSKASANRQIEISCIPSYCRRSYLFMILCPPVRHTETDSLLSYKTWSDRGWCRLERMARALGHSNGFVIRVEDASTPALSGNASLALYDPPGKGTFTVEDDKQKIAPVIKSMIEDKLQYFLMKKDLHNHRFLLSLQRHYLSGLESDWIECSTGFRCDIDPQVDPSGFTAARFLHDMAFLKVSQRDSAGWSPLCYAVVQGDAEVVKALLEKKAHCNDAIKKTKADAHLLAKTSVLDLSAAYCSNDVMKLLLSSRASVNSCDVLGFNALTAVAMSDNADGARILCEANMDPTARAGPHHHFTMAASFNSISVMEELCRQSPLDLSCTSDWSLKTCLFHALAAYAGKETILRVIQARADVNQQYNIPMKEPLIWMVYRFKRLQHFISPSAFTRLAYHQHGATPIMFAVSEL